MCPGRHPERISNNVILSYLQFVKLFGKSTIPHTAGIVKVPDVIIHDLSLLMMLVEILDSIGSLPLSQ